jgi:hypothetical protein
MSDLLRKKSLSSVECRSAPPVLRISNKPAAPALCSHCILSLRSKPYSLYACKRPGRGRGVLTVCVQALAVAWGYSRLPPV